MGEKVIREPLPDTFPAPRGLVFIRRRPYGCERAKRAKQPYDVHHGEVLLIEAEGRIIGPKSHHRNLL